MDDFCSLENIINLIDLPDFINPGGGTVGLKFRRIRINSKDK